MQFNKEYLRLYYLEELDFSISLLQQIKEMNEISLLLRSRPFAGWNSACDDSLIKLKNLKKYLQIFTNTWKYEFYDYVISTIPLEDYENQMISYNNTARHMTDQDFFDMWKRNKKTKD